MFKKTFRKMAFEILKPEDVQIINTLDAPEHYTVVYFLPEDIKAQVFELANKLISIDKSIILNQPDKYHVTLFNCPISTNINKVTTALKDFFQTKSLKVIFTNFIVGPIGMAVCGYSENYDLINLRKNLYMISGQDFPNDHRASALWTTIGRFSQIPKKEVIKFIRANFEINLGIFEIRSAVILKNHTKNLEGAIEIAKIN